MTQTKLLIISGKGGVGKTTIAAATALGAAAKTYRTLIVSLDRAHNLGDVFQTSVSPKPEQIDSSLPLFAMEMDPQTELRRSWDVLQGYLQTFLQYLGLDSVTAEEMAVFPGLEELLVLARLADLAETGEYDLIVVDMAPTASSLRYLSFPDMMEGMLGTLVKWDQRFASILRPLQGKFFQMPVPDQAVYSSLKDLADRLKTLRNLLQDPNRTVVRLVMIPETIVFEETKRALTYLNLFGLTVDEIIVNRVLPTEALDGYLAGWGNAQQRILQLAKDVFTDTPLLTLTFQAEEVLGVKHLKSTLGALYGSEDPAHFHGAGRSLEYVHADETTTLVVHLPHAAGQNLDLRRHNGDLIITVDGWRRVIALPDSLLHRDITKARLAKGQLTVHFANDTNR